MNSEHWCLVIFIHIPTRLPGYFYYASLLHLHDAECIKIREENTIQVFFYLLFGILKIPLYYYVFSYLQTRQITIQINYFSSIIIEMVFKETDYKLSGVQNQNKNDCKLVCLTYFGLHRLDLQSHLVANRSNRLGQLLHISHNWHNLLWHSHLKL